MTRTALNKKLAPLGLRVEKMEGSYYLAGANVVDPTVEGLTLEDVAVTLRYWRNFGDFELLAVQVLSL